MEIIVAKSAGFCFGVKNAIDKVNHAVSQNVKVKTYGPIIHNSQVVEKLRQKGVSILNDINDLKKDTKIVIRSHGVSKEELTILENNSLEVVDATCPFVKNIHRIVEKKSQEGYRIIIIGDKNHPEVKGIAGWCSKEAIIIQDENEVVEKMGKVAVVAQTTFNREKWKTITSNIIGLSKEMIIFDTICSATDERQKEVREISKEAEVMIVVGGKDSSNSRKLYDIAKENCENSIFIETADEINVDDMKNLSKIGITAGASTPDYVIEDVIKKIKGIEVELNVKKEMEAFTEEDLDMYFDKMDNIHVGSKVKGTVLHVGNREMYLDIGYKSDAVLPIGEIICEAESLKGMFNPGEVIEVQVIKMNDGEGNVLVSRKAIEKDNQIEKIRVFEKSGEEIEVSIKEEVKGGFKGEYLGVKVFMPMSLSGTRNASDVLGKKIKVKINQIKEDKRDMEIVVSRKEIVEAERLSKREEIFNSLSVGDVIDGTVKAIIESGLFINIGAVDVFIPKAELTWSRINNIHDKFKEGDELSAILLRVDKDEKRVSGSVKRAKTEPFEDMVSKYSEEDIIKVKVLRFTDFGAFVEVIDGVDGLVHISKISDKRINKPEEALKIGEIVNAKIIKIDKGNKKVELSIKDAK